MFGKNEKSTINLFDLKPERLFDFHVLEDGLVTVAMPRFHVAWMQKYLVPKSKDPFIKIKLDTFGSHVWKLCDGNTTVASIAESLIRAYGEEVQPVDDRLRTFFHQLNSRGFTRLRKPDGDYLR